MFLKIWNSNVLRNMIEEDDEDEDDEEDEDFEDVPEDWEELNEDEKEEELGDDNEELELMSSDGYAQLANSGLLGKLPPYYFHTPKQQKVFFNKLNQNYIAKMENLKTRQIGHSRKVNFQMAKNTVKGRVV